MSVMSPPPSSCNLSVRTVVNLCTFGVFALMVMLGFRNCNYICMCVANKLFELIEFVLDSVYVDLQNDEIYLTFTAGSVYLCCVCNHVIFFNLSVRMLWYPMWMRWLR